MSKVKPKKIDENHSFNVNIACIVGERKAILLKEIYGWCDRNLSNNRNVYFGLPWTYNSATAYAEKFPYWTEKSIARWLKELQADGWIYATDQFNKFRIDRTKWYTINFERYDQAVVKNLTSKSQNEKWLSQIEKSLSQNEKSEPPKMRDDISQNEEPIPSHTISYPSNTSKSARAKKPTKKTETRKPEITADQTKENVPPVAAHPPREKEADDSFLTEPIPDLGQPHWTEVATKMAEYFKDENGFGPIEWRYMCDSAGGSVDPMVITTIWAGKAEPYELLNWKKHTGKLTNWIKNNLKSDRTTEAKIKSLNKGSTNERLKVGAFGNQPQREIVVSKVPL